ncbi:hypothetical protein [Companilactobacillus futsaii]|uniref:hypothetical protein n=1 Tax=Companilactobacillus futsaii TaxID=938155 RepID=UPI00189CA58D|nr:hypothetical protein [Companilactobacillus futsaii]
MKKLLSLVALLSLILAGCSFQNQQQDSKEQTKLIQKNKKVWNKRLKKAQTVEFPGEKIISVPAGYNDEDMSLTRFKNGSQLVVKARVIDLKPELKRVLTPETKASIYIDKVISGDKTLQYSTIKTEFSGGLIHAKNYLVNIEGQYTGEQFGIKNPQAIVYGQTLTKPMPKIGQTIILVLNKRQSSKNFYVVNNPEVTFWIKRNDKYRLNNPAFYQVQNQSKYSNIFKITKYLNQNF